MKFTSTETGIEFKKIAKTAKAIDKKQYDALIEALVRRRIQEEEKVQTLNAFFVYRDRHHELQFSIEFEHEL